MKGVTKGNIKKYALNEFLTEYKELNTDNKYRPVAVGRYGIRKRESIYSKELAKDYSKNKLIHKGTLTVGMGSKQIDIGILIEDETFAVSPAYHTYEIQGIRCKYLEYCLQSKNIEMFSLYAKRGSRQGKSIDLKRWLTYKIPVYSEKDQIVIEENLNKINYVIELRRKQIDLLDELVKARFVEMFGTVYDKKFDMKTLPDIVSNDKNSIKRGPFGGALKKDDFLKEGYLVYEQRHAIHEDFEYAKYYISKEKYESMIGFKVIPGDLIISCSGVTLGRIAEVPNDAKEGIINQALLKISLNKDIMNNKFFIYQFRCKEIQEMLFGFSRGSGIPNMPSMKEVKAFKFICPPLELQNQFASFVQEIDKSRLRELLAIKHIKLLLNDSWLLFY